MKKLYTILATAFAFALIVASPMATITSHAQGLNINAPTNDADNGTMPDNYWSNSNSTNSGSNESNNSGFNESNESAPAPSYNGGHGFNANAPTNDADNGEMPGNYWNTVNNANNVTAGVTGGQKFRIVMNTDHTTYQVYHCGISRASFTVTDAEGNAVAFSTVKLEKGEDNLWYENITFAEGVDTKDFTLTVTKGDASYLSTELDVSGIKVNGTLVLSTVPADPVQVDEDSVVGHRYCVCGAAFDIRKNSGIDKDAWNAHMREHAAKGESARYTDK